VRLLYFVALFDEEINVQGVAPRMIVPPVDATSMRLLISQYERWVPLRADDVHAVTRGHFDFSYGLLESLRMQFEMWPGARPLGADSPWVLLEGALRTSEDLKKAGRMFVDDIRKRLLGAGPICDFIRKSVVRHTDESSLQPAMKKDVPIRPGDFAIGEYSAVEISRALDQMVELHILQRAENTYYLREKLPFFLESYKLNRELRDWATNVKVFVSYAHQDLAIAERISQWLQDFGANVWWDRRVYRPDFRTEIDHELFSSHVVLALWSKNSISSDWVRSEAETARKQRKLLSLGVDVEAASLPRPFEQSTVFEWRDRERDRILKAMEEVARCHGRSRNERQGS